MAEEELKTDGGVQFPRRCYAYAPDGPSTWKLRLFKKPSDVLPSARYVGAAIAALGKGFRGQKVQIPSGDLAAAKAKVRAAWRKLNPEGEIPPAIRG